MSECGPVDANHMTVVTAASYFQPEQMERGIHLLYFLHILGNTLKLLPAFFVISGK